MAPKSVAEMAIAKIEAKIQELEAAKALVLWATAAKEGEELAAMKPRKLRRKRKAGLPAPETSADGF